MSRLILKRTEVYPEDSAFAYREKVDDYERDEPVTVLMLGRSDSDKPVPLGDRAVFSVEWTSPMGDDFAVLFDAAALVGWIAEAIT